MNHNLKKIVRRVLMESLTESEPLWYRLSDNILNELGIKLYNPNDEAYVVEIHFDTKNIFIQLYTEEFNELVPYWDSEQVPRNVKDTFTIPFSEIPRSLKSIIARRLDPKYYKYL
tara:strand:+ start:121 stop:465 length:345 start_codon:yes stop_codon:yes gene_type:complete